MMLIKLIWTCLLIVPSLSWGEKYQCVDYIQSSWEYTCVKRTPIYNGLKTKIYEVNKGPDTFMMKVTKLDAQAYNELSVLLRLRETKYVPELFENKTTDDSLIMILTNGNYSNLLVAMKERKEFQSTKFILQFFRKIIEGVDLIHRAKFSHNDLKPENILVTKTLDPLIIDFDIAVPLDTNALGQGSPIFIAPENMDAIEKEEMVFYDEKTDIFALGAILYLMVFGDTPIRSTKKYEDFLNTQIVFPKTTPKIIAEIIQGCYSLRENRYSMATLKKMVDKAITAKTLFPLGFEYRYEMNSHRQLNDDYYYQRYKSFIYIILALVVLAGITFVVFRNRNKLEDLNVGVEIKEKKVDIETPMQH